MPQCQGPRAAEPDEGPWLHQTVYYSQKTVFETT